MLILKIMSNLDCADADPSKGFQLISNVLNVKFTTAMATEHEKSLMKYEGDDDLIVSFADCTVSDSNSSYEHHSETHLLTGNCYVLNDRGKTIESFWARRSPAGDLVGES